MTSPYLNLPRRTQAQAQLERLHRNFGIPQEPADFDESILWQERHYHHRRRLRAWLYLYILAAVIGGTLAFMLPWPK